MLDILFERLRRKTRTVPFPASAPVLPERYRGRPAFDVKTCAAVKPEDWATAVAGCPSGAFRLNGAAPELDMGRCLFCGRCAENGPAGALRFTGDWRLAASRREDLILTPGKDGVPAVAPTEEGSFVRSFKLRQVSAAGCGACEADLNVLGTIVFDLPRFGMDYVASPRHADALVITGPVPRNMHDALIKADRAVSKPRAVLAVGACAVSGGVFAPKEGEASPQRNYGAAEHLEVDLFIPGCVPHPYTLLDGLLRFLGHETPGPAE